VKPEEVYKVLNLQCFYCGHMYRYHVGVKDHHCLPSGSSPAIGICDCPGWLYLESYLPDVPTAEDLYQALRVQDP
jgi:hypothetical protein